MNATDAQWDFPVRYNGDIYAVNRSGTSGKTELHVLSAASDYQDFSNHVATGLAPTDANWVFGVNIDGDLFAICRSGGSGKVEIHVLSQSSNYQDFRVHAATALHPVDSTWDLLVGPEDDLYAVTRQGASGMTEVHVMRASNAYSTLAFQKATALGASGPDFTFAISANRDLCAALHHGSSGTAEVHVLSADSDYQGVALHAATALHPTDNSWAFAAPQPFSPGFITRHGASGKVEVHVPALEMPRSQFQSKYMDLLLGLSDAQLIDCGVQAGIWGAGGAAAGGGVRGFIAGAVTGCLASIPWREIISNYLSQNDHDRFLQMDHNNRDLEDWDRNRDTA